MASNPQGKRITSENLAGQVTTAAWDCCFAYGYNEKSELTNAVAAVDSDYRYAYDFDDIGNRETSSERGTNRVYSANELNQYSSITTLTSDVGLQTSSFPPQFDKAIKTITKIEWAQVIHYLRATRIPYAMLVNFGRPSIQYDTFELDKLPSSSVLVGMDTAAKPPIKQT